MTTHIPPDRLKTRFWAKVDKTGECWLWTGAQQPTGYGGYGWKDQGGSFKAGAHRIAFIWERGEIPEGFQLDHLCKTRNCVRPSHLEVVTARENLLRGDTLPAQQVLRTHCPQGHAYSGANLVIKGGSRRCRICLRVQWNAFYARKASIKVLETRKDKTASNYLEDEFAAVLATGEQEREE